MDRKEAIETIEMLFPADNSEEGKKLLINAIYMGWRSLPDDILKKYAMLCQWRDSGKY